MFETFVQEQERLALEAEVLRLREEEQREEQKKREEDSEAAIHQSRQERILKEIEEETSQNIRLPPKHFARGDPTGWLPQEALNSQVHLGIVESVLKLRAVAEDMLGDVLEVDRLTIGNDCHVYEYIHEDIPGQTPHSVQRRTLIALYSRDNNMF